MPELLLHSLNTSYIIFGSLLDIPPLIQSSARLCPFELIFMEKGSVILLLWVISVELINPWTHFVMA